MVADKLHRGPRYSSSGDSTLSSNSYKSCYSDEESVSPSGQYENYIPQANQPPEGRSISSRGSFRQGTKNVKSMPNDWADSILQSGHVIYNNNMFTASEFLDKKPDHNFTNDQNDLLTSHGQHPERRSEQRLAVTPDRQHQARLSTQSDKTLLISPRREHSKISTHREQTLMVSPRREHSKISTHSEQTLMVSPRRQLQPKTSTQSDQTPALIPEKSPRVSTQSENRIKRSPNNGQSPKSPRMSQSVAQSPVENTHSVTNIDRHQEKARTSERKIQLSPEMHHKQQIMTGDGEVEPSVSKSPIESKGKKRRHKRKRSHRPRDETEDLIQDNGSSTSEAQSTLDLVIAVPPSPNVGLQSPAPYYGQHSPIHLNPNVSVQNPSPAHSVSQGASPHKSPCPSPYKSPGPSPYKSHGQGQNQGPSPRPSPRHSSRVKNERSPADGESKHSISVSPLPNETLPLRPPPRGNESDIGHPRSGQSHSVYQTVLGDSNENPSRSGDRYSVNTNLHGDSHVEWDPRSVPVDFLCPITNKIMRYPVTASDGIVYEKRAISDWLQSSKLSPVTRQPITDLLWPDVELKSKIKEWKLQRKQQNRTLEQMARKTSSNTCGEVQC